MRYWDASVDPGRAPIGQSEGPIRRPGLPLGLWLSTDKAGQALALVGVEP
jgi:hypothetical protein